MMSGACCAVANGSPEVEGAWRIQALVTNCQPCNPKSYIHDVLCSGCNTEHVMYSLRVPTDVSHV